MKKAFTLIELLIVVAIIALLISILLPALQKSREAARQVYCLNNVRQMLVAASCYTDSNNGKYPIAYQYDDNWNEFAWDFFIIYDQNRCEPGWLWQGNTIPKIQECPSCSQDKNWGRPYTGYNYNTSYIGGRFMNGEFKECAKIDQIQDPVKCVVFGEGQYYDGPTNYMRAPLASAADGGAFSGVGTQGYRHNRRTNAGFADGHAESWAKRYRPTSSLDGACLLGFLSEDNSLYDLE